MLVLRVANEREMRVKNKSEGTGIHCGRLRGHYERSRRIGMQYFTLHRGVHQLRFARDDSSERSAKVLEAVQALFDHVKACRVPEPDGTIVTESSTRYDGDV